MATSFHLSRRVWAALLALGLTVIGLGVAFSVLPNDTSQRLIHVEPSRFAPVLVFDEFGQRCMNFETIDDPGRQSCFLRNDPDKMVFAYTRMMTSALFVKPDPQRILIIGLGGATLPLAFARILPNAVIDSVEIDPAVVRVAERFFAYSTGERQRLTVDDGRVFVENALKTGQRYDMIMLDAFDVDYIPAHLSTKEFFENVWQLLSNDGVFVANTFTQTRLYDRETATYAAVFGRFFSLRSGAQGNRVIIASRQALPSMETLEHNAKALSEKLAPFGIETQAALARFAYEPIPQPTARPLSDAGT